MLFRYSIIDMNIKKNVEQIQLKQTDENPETGAWGRSEAPPVSLLS